MTKKEFLKEVEKMAEKRLRVNSNNDWGFGGMVGSIYTFKRGVTLKIGKAYYRHAPSERFVTLSQWDVRFVDTLQGTIKWEKLYEKINALVTQRHPKYKYFVLEHGKDCDGSYTPGRWEGFEDKAETDKYLTSCLEGSDDLGYEITKSYARVLEYCKFHNIVAPIS